MVLALKKTLHMIVLTWCVANVHCSFKCGLELTAWQEWKVVFKNRGIKMRDVQTYIISNCLAKFDLQHSLHIFYLPIFTLAKLNLTPFQINYFLPSSLYSCILYWYSLTKRLGEYSLENFANICITIFFLSKLVKIMEALKIDWFLPTYIWKFPCSKLCYIV